MGGGTSAEMGIQQDMADGENWMQILNLLCQKNNVSDHKVSGVAPIYVLFCFVICDFFFHTLFSFSYLMFVIWFHRGDKISYVSWLNLKAVGENQGAMDDIYVVY